MERNYELERMEKEARLEQKVAAKMKKNELDNRIDTLYSYYVKNLELYGLEDPKTQSSIRIIETLIKLKKIIERIEEVSATIETFMLISTTIDDLFSGMQSVMTVALDSNFTKYKVQRQFKKGLKKSFKNLKNYLTMTEKLSTDLDKFILGFDKSLNKMFKVKKKTKKGEEANFSPEFISQFNEYKSRNGVEEKTDSTSTTTTTPSSKPTGSSDVDDISSVL